MDSPWVVSAPATVRCPPMVIAPLLSPACRVRRLMAPKALSVIARTASGRMIAFTASAADNKNVCAALTVTLKVAVAVALLVSVAV